MMLHYSKLLIQIKSDVSQGCKFNICQTNRVRVESTNVFLLQLAEMNDYMQIPLRVNSCNQPGAVHRITEAQLLLHERVPP